MIIIVEPVNREKKKEKREREKERNNSKQPIVIVYTLSCRLT